MDEIIYERVTPKVFRKGFNGVSDHAMEIGLNAIAGLADWIGLGGVVKNLMEGTGIYQNLDDIKSKLRNRINYLISQNSIDLDQLERRLSNLEAGGFNLTGIALDKYRKELIKTRNEHDKAKRIHANNELKLTEAQADTDALNAESTSVAQLQSQYEAAQKIMNQLS